MTDWGPRIVIPMKTGRGMNSRGHWRVAHRRNLAEQECVAWALVERRRPPVPCSVVLTRFAPSCGLDDDNLAGALKATRDAVAKWLGVDDGNRATVRFRYAQTRAAWAVGIEFGEPVRGAQGVLDFIDLEG